MLMTMMKPSKVYLHMHVGGKTKTKTITVTPRPKGQDQVRRLRWRDSNCPPLKIRP